MFRRMGDNPNPEQKETEEAKVFRFGPWTLNTETAELSKDSAAGEQSSTVYLPVKEYELLTFLAQNAGKPFTPDALYKAVWKQDYGDIVTIPVHIQRLRKKIEADPSAPVFIQTVRGFGYKLILNSDEAKK
jgi:DNA-binding response OmpR family regulator